MSAEINETSKVQSTSPVEAVQGEISSTNIEPQPRISEDIKKLLNSLLQKTLDKRIIRLEHRYQEQRKNNELTAKSFKAFTLQLQSLVKNMEETLKKKATKKKEETPKRLKSNTSKSLPHGKKLKINKQEYSTARNTDKKKMLNTTNYKTENNDKESHFKVKSLKGSRVLSEANIKKGKTKLLKKPIHDLTNKDDKKEDIKSKTMSNYHTEKKSDSKRDLGNTINNKNKAKDKNIKKNDELTKTFSEPNISDKIKKNIDKGIKSEKKVKKNISHFQTKNDVRINTKEKSEKKDIKKKDNQNKKEIVKKEEKRKEKNEVKIEEKKEEKKEDKKEEKNEDKKEEKNEDKKEEKKEDKKDEKKEEEKKEEPKKEENKLEEKKEENNMKEEQKEETNIVKEAKVEEENKNEKKEEQEKPKEEEKIKEEPNQNTENIKKDENIESTKEKEQLKEEPNLPSEELKEKGESLSEPPKKEETQKPPEDKAPEPNKEEIKSEVNKLESQTSSPPQEVDSQKKEEENNTENIVEGNNDKLIEEFKKEYIEKVKEEMTNNCELHNVTLNPILNQSLNSSMSFSQSFLMSKSMMDEPLPKLPPRDPNKPMTMDEIIKDFKNAFIYVLDFLNLQEKIAFTGIHRGFKAERAYLFNLKRDEIISSLELRDRETLDDRIVQFKLKHSQNDLAKPFGEFSVSKAAAKTVVLLNNELYSKLFKIPILDDNLSDIYIIYRLLFVLLGEHEIADIMDDRLFWAKCTEYLITKSNGKIGTFIVEKSKNFDFSHKSICLMNRLLVGIKPKIVPTTFTKISGTTGLLFFLIKDSLEYCGVLINEKKTPASRIYDNLMHYKNLIASLDNYIDFLSKLRLLNK